MPTDLKQLTVSLTKHGAHKIAVLIQKYEMKDVLKNISGVEPGVNIELAQARKTLSVDSRGAIPAVWAKAKRSGNEAVDALVLVAIIFSHHELISVMQSHIGLRRFTGRVTRGTGIDGKAYTNLANNIEELGYSTEHSKEHVDYDFSKIFHIPRLNTLVTEVFRLKLLAAGWSAKGEIVDEAVRLGFHDVFSAPEDDFRKWLGTGDVREEFSREEASFFLDATDSPTLEDFAFRPGHKKKKTGRVNVTFSSSETTASLLHNEIQNDLYTKLVAKYGEDCVGTEIDTGQGTAIDIVLKTTDFCWFYEIKTAESVKACIRQAIPQLLEYAYWDGDADRANRLYIVSPLMITQEAENYLAFLRKTFGLEIYYLRHEL